MRRVTTWSVALLSLLAATTVSAQMTKTITGETKTVTATIEAIEKGTRELTLKMPDGTYNVVEATNEVKRFDDLKVGDTITVKYYENVVLRLKPAGEKAKDVSESADTRGTGAKPAGTMARQRTITATITAIDPKVPSITFSGPNGWKYSSKVEDKKALAKVKVGDKVDITWTDAVLISVEPPK
jgi:hypothetical protein